MRVATAFEVEFLSLVKLKLAPGGVIALKSEAGGLSIGTLVGLLSIQLAVP